MLSSPSQRLACRKLIEECFLDLHPMGKKRSVIGQKEEQKFSANPTGVSEAGMSLWKCPMWNMGV
jgi:hypothetical protein